jgi:hypothetical protein
MAVSFQLKVLMKEGPSQGAESVIKKYKLNSLRTLKCILFLPNFLYPLRFGFSYLFLFCARFTSTDVSGLCTSDNIEN